MKTFRFPGVVAAFALAAIAAPAVSAQVSASGLYKGTVPNSGPTLFVAIENNFAVQVFAFDAAAQKIGVARGALVSGVFSLNLSNGATVTGTAPAAAGGALTGNYTASGNAQAYSAALIPFKSNGSSIAGIYTGRSHPERDGNQPGLTLPQRLLWFAIDLDNRIAFVETTLTGTGTPTYAGGTGTVTATGTGDATTYNFTVTNSTSGSSTTGSFTKDGGELEGTYAVNGGSTQAFDVFRGRFANRLVNISTRGFVTTGQGQLIGGFVIEGGPKQVLIIVRGPSLAQFGVSPVLADPKVQLFRGQTVIATNDDWQTSANIFTMRGIVFTSTLDPKDSVILTTLEPGPYTSVVTSSDGQGTGIALVEVYETDWQ